MIEIHRIERSELRPYRSTLVSTPNDPREAMLHIAALPAGEYVVCELGGAPCDWRPIMKMEDGTIYLAWGAVAKTKRSFYADKQ